jgi:hypothetical protein
MPALNLNVEMSVCDELPIAIDWSFCKVITGRAFFCSAGNPREIRLLLSSTYERNIACNRTLLM